MNNSAAPIPKPYRVTGRTLAAYWPVIRRYRWLVAAHMITVTLAVGLQNILIPWLLALAIKELPGFVTRGASPADFSAVFGQLIMVYILAQVSAQLLWRLSGVAVTLMEARAMRDIEQDIFRHLTTLSYRFFANTFGGSLVTQANRFVSSFERLYDTVTLQFLPLLVRAAGAVIVIYVFSPVVALGLLAFCILFMTSAIFLFEKKMPASRRAAEAQTKLTGRLADSLSNISAIKYFAREKDEIASYNHLSTVRMRLNIRNWALAEAIIAWQALLMAAFETVVFIGSLHLVAVQAIDFSQFVLIQAYVWSVFGVLWGMGGIVRNVERSLSDAVEMTLILEQQPELTDHPGSEPVTIKHGALELKNVTFAYHERNSSQPVFQELNLVVKPGERIGLVGTSGGGKTTVTKLLLRLMDIQGGQILLDGHDIATMRQGDVRRAISYVPQEPLLFHRSLRENIAYGHPNATESDVLQAARRAHAHEFIKTLPHGYDTLVGERGIKLSGGQRQRVAIARAMLKDAPVLVLDEATSALDSQSERLIQDALWHLMEGRTAIVIAHRLSTIQRMDRIVVLENGRIVEQGTHAHLLGAGGVYAQLWTHQSGGFIEE